MVHNTRDPEKVAAVVASLRQLCNIDTSTKVVDSSSTTQCNVTASAKPFLGKYAYFFP